MASLIEHPWLAAVIGILLLGVGPQSRRRTVTVVGGLWLLYAVYETGMRQRWLCSGECNIRVDLLVIHPLLLAGVAACGASLLRRPNEPRSRA